MEDSGVKFTYSNLFENGEKESYFITINELIKYMYTHIYFFPISIFLSPFLIMAHNTWSHGSHASSESGDIAQAELEILKRNMMEKEKQLQEQAQALRRKQSELDKRSEY